MVMTKNYIYAYSEPHTDDGIIKIGQTTNPNIKEYLDRTIQARNSSKHKKYELLYSAEAKYNNKDEYFTDHTVHNFLKEKGYNYLTDEKTGKKTEEYNIEILKLKSLIENIKEGKKPEEIDINRYQKFDPRPEQEVAIKKTQKYFKDKPTGSFLWNAKMRFGKTFAAYKLMKEQDYKKVLILTYKPAVHNQWQSDLENHKDFKDYHFLSVKNKNIKNISNYERTVCFMSYQDMIRKTENSEIKEKHIEIYNTKWDLVIIDEFHYGSSTQKAKDIFEKIPSEEIIIQRDMELEKLKEEDLDPTETKLMKESIEKEFQARMELSTLSVKYKLYLSGTPFKALENGIFSYESIFNWTYRDEQKAKAEWDKPNNPYASLPKIELFVYQVSQELLDYALDKETNEFSLNQFFKATKEGKSAYFGDKEKNNDKNVNQWLNDISGMNLPKLSIDDQIDNIEYQGVNFPYSSNSPFVEKIKHTLWYMPNIASALAMEKLLQKHPIFKGYKVITVVGGRSKSGSDALPPVELAIRNNEQTITLTCGMLTTGVSVPEWSAVFFLRDIKTPESYFQTAFRAQTPYTDINGNIKKDTAYIFDFSPNRSLRLLTEYSEKLSDKKEKSSAKEKIHEFVKYLPVLKISGNRMIHLNASEVLKFDYDKLDAISLGKKFSDTINIKIDSEMIELMNNDKEMFDAIFSKIKKFSEFNGKKKDQKKKDQKEKPVNINSMNTSEGKIEDLKTTKAKKELLGEDTKKEVKEIDLEKKSLDKEKKRIRELLKTLLSRIPLFMYLTNASEENLEEVLAETERDLFRQATGLTSDEFRFLKGIGLIKIDSIEGYILKYKEFEDNNYEELNKVVFGEK